MHYPSGLVFNQYPLGGFSIEFFKQNLATDLSETPKSSAKLDKGFSQTSLDFLCKSIGTEFIRSYSDEEIQTNPEFFIEIFKAQISLKKKLVYLM